MTDINDTIEQWEPPEGVKMPYTKKLQNGLWEIFDGQRVSFAGDELYYRFQKEVLNFGTKEPDKKL